MVVYVICRPISLPSTKREEDTRAETPARTASIGQEIRVEHNSSDVRDFIGFTDQNGVTARGG